MQASDTGNDGPSGESKEVLGGYWFIFAHNLDEAVQIAKGDPCLDHRWFVEIRPITFESRIVNDGLEAFSNPSLALPAEHEHSILEMESVSKERKNGARDSYGSRPDCQPEQGLLAVRGMNYA
jgi:YCII-related domain